MTPKRKRPPLGDVLTVTAWPQQQLLAPGLLVGRDHAGGLAIVTARLGDVGHDAIFLSHTECVELGRYITTRTWTHK